MFDWMRRLLVIKTPLPVIRSFHHEKIERLLASRVDNSVYLDAGVIETIVPNIEEYTNWLDTLRHALFEDIVFPLHEFRLMRVCKCSFYLNAKGVPVDAEAVHQRFVTLAVSVLRRHEEVLLMDKRSPMLEASLYRAKALFFNIFVITDSLSGGSLHARTQV